MPGCIGERAEPWDYAAMAIAESLAASIVGGRSSNCRQ